MALDSSLEGCLAPDSLCLALGDGLAPGKLGRLLLAQDRSLEDRSALDRLDRRLALGSRKHSS